MLASELALLVVALLVPLTASLPVRSSLGLRGAPVHVMLAAAFGTVMLGPVGDMLMTLLATLMPGASLGVVPALREVAQTFPLWLTWPAFALMPGVAEELLFRGVVQRSIAAPALAVVVSGVTFAAFHVDPIHVAGVLPLGLFLAWVGQRAGTLVTIFAHLVNNSVALLTIRTGTMDVGYATGHEMPIAWVVASVAGAVLAVRIIARATRTQV
jgi:membrane protease YdiL (CAAX protease family)